ncbi:MAG: hypothetical protein ACD_49C00070G0016 [uncultured bacterium (gcode 4)]|uniref:Uncharacterized protein n=1 Tax=uncultured bacterium (gcode 4) TaxID=1234023 RepID=K2AVX3_9BACT|nr:MAG: hypothetical protein ACD_49C00070G0016 [uncultured bacterium (gcode 4)]
MSKRTLLDRTIGSNLVQWVIDETVWNLTQKHFQTPHRDLKRALEKYARDIWRAVLTNQFTVDIKDNDWKNNLDSRTSDTLLKSWKLDGIITKTKWEIKSQFPKLIWEVEWLNIYSLKKIAIYTAYVSHVLNNKLDPEILEWNPEDIQKELMRLYWKLQKQGTNVLMVNDNSNPEEVAEAIKEIIDSQILETQNYNSQSI